ncbi:MAG: S8 family peptidase, partial [Lachnospiraceae bacterium]|nr:S8 family peptidase [Lachnospiraceae bacterium]
HSYDAEIVGYLELTDDYQIEFYEEITPEQLRALREELAQNRLVERCDYNLSAETDCDFYTNDAEWNNLSWNSSQPSGRNWNVEMIDLEGALVNAGVIPANAVNADASDLSGLATVKIGLIDSAFDVWHEDLGYVMVWNNYSNPVDLRTAANVSYNMHHGSHVAGIMAAGYNNGKGITGICLKPFLYGFSMYGDTLSYAALEQDSTMKLQYALDLMIGNHVKVINYSRGDATNAFAASQHEQYAIDFMEERTDKIDDFLGELIDKGYDFLIVTSAGNANNLEFYKYTFYNEGVPEDRYVSVGDYYRSLNQANKYVQADTSITYGAPNSNAINICNEVDAKYNNEFSYSQDSRVQDRVIVVGAIEKPTGTTGTYNVANFSNTGSRVNILAPGDTILSCMVSGMGLDYDYQLGTSMAAPHVSGVAGLAYNVNPDISAPELKDIIVSNYQMTIDRYGVLNAAEVIAAAVQYETPEEYTIQLHVTGADGSGVRDATVEVRSRSFYWCKVLGAAMRSDAVGSTIVYSGKTDTAGNIKLDIPQGNYYVLVDGEYGGVLEEIHVSSEDIMEQTVKGITLPDYQPEKTRGVILQLSSSTAGENVNSYGLIINGEFRFIKGWIDTDKENIRLEDYVREGEVTVDGGEEIAVYHTRADFGDISVRLPEGIYTVEVSLPDAEPKYYHIIISDKYDFSFYRFEM